MYGRYSRFRVPSEFTKTSILTSYKEYNILNYIKIYLNMNLNRPFRDRRMVVGGHLSIVGLDIGLISYFGGKVDLCGTHLIIWLYGHCIIHSGLAACSGRLPECTLNNSFLDCCYFCLYALVYPGTIFGRIFEIVWVIYGMVLIHYARLPILFYTLCCVSEQSFC